MAETRDIKFRFLGDARDLDRATRKAKGDLGDVESKAGKASKAYGGLNTAVGGFAAAISVAAIGDFVVDTAKLAEQAQLAGESAEKVLGPALDGLHERFDGLRETMGLNIGEFDTTVAKFGLLTESMGLSDEAQAEFIGNLIETGGELAAFRGNVGDAPEAIDAMGAALRGEFDPLEQFGVKLSEAAIKEKELELRADPVNDKLTDQEIRIKAVTDLINEKAKKAIGSLSESEETLAGKTNIATTRFEDLRIELGEKLAGPMAAVLDFLIEAIEGFENLMNPETFTNTELYRLLDGIEDKIDAVVSAVSNAIDWVQNLLDLQDNVTPYRRGPTPPDDETGFGRRHATGPMGVRTVGGPIGQPVPIIAHGGEKIGMGVGGGVVNITIQTLDPAAAGRAVVQALQTYNRANGAIPIRVRG